MAFLMVTFSIHCSSDFLEVPPSNAVYSSDLETLEGAENLLIGTYSMLTGRAGGFFGGSDNWLWGSVLGGDANRGTESGDPPGRELQRFEVLPSDDFILLKYRTLYEGIARSNSTIKIISTLKDDITLDDKIRMEAEAKFLRAHFYFDLKKNFNNTPYVDEEWDEITPVPNNLNLWHFIEEDLQFAYENLPVTQVAIGRANKYAAAAYLAKTLLYRKEFERAKELFDIVIQNGTTSDGTPYQLLDQYADVFRSIYDNHSESVFAVQAAVNTGTPLNSNFSFVLNFPNAQDGPGACCGYFQPSFDLVNSFRTGANGLPLLDASYNQGSNLIKSDMGIESSASFSMDQETLDPRLDHSVGRRGIPYLDWGLHPGKRWIRNQAYGGPYSPKKFVYYKEGIGVENESTGWGALGLTAVNYCIIRYADVLLMAAETEIELGNIEQGRDYINQIRQRAKQSQLTEVDANYHIELYESFQDQEQARKAVRFERKLELSGEGHRFYDLVRWGIAAETINEYLEHEDQYLTDPFAGAKFEKGKHEYLPIPQQEIDLVGNEVLIQNPGYIQ